MASVRARLKDPQPPSPSLPTHNPAVWPSWLPQNQHSLTVTSSSSAHSIIWSIENFTLRAATLPLQEVPTTAVLAHFPPLDESSNSRLTDSSLPEALSWKSALPATLCVSSSTYVVIFTPDSDLYCPVPDGRFSALRITNLFVPASGLIIEVSHPSRSNPIYYFLSHPLHKMTIVPIPSSHKVIYVSRDISLLASRSNDSLFVWTFTNSEREPSNQVLEPSPNDTVAALIASAAPPEEVSKVSDELPRYITLTLNQVYVANATQGDKISIFLSHDAQGLLVLCIVTSGSLTGLSLKQGPGLLITEVKPEFRVRDVESAVPVLSVRRPHSCLDVLVRHFNGAYSLFMGRNRLCTVEIQPSRSDLIYTLVDAVGDEFTLRDCEGVNIRFTLRRSCFQSSLVNECISALGYVFEGTNNMRRVMVIYHDMLKARMSLTGAFFDRIEQEWNMFEEVLLQSADAVSADNSHPERMDVDGDASDIDSEDDWAFLLGCNYHISEGLERSYGPIPPVSLTAPVHVPIVKPADADLLFNILQALHLLYENFKFDKLAHDKLALLARLNTRIGIAIGASSFVDHYMRDFPELASFNSNWSSPSLREQIKAPSLLDALERKMQGYSKQKSTYPELSVTRNFEHSQHSSVMASWRSKSPFEISRTLLSYYEYLYNSHRGGESREARAEALLLAMVRDNFLRADLDSLPFGVALPLRDALWLCRQCPKNSWPFEAFALIAREDLFEFGIPGDITGDIQNQNSHDPTDESRALLQIRANGAFLNISSAENVVSQEPEIEKNKAVSKAMSDSTDEEDGCDLDQDLHKLRFSEDKRLEEVRRILRSTDVTVMMSVQLPDSESVSDFDLVAEQKFKLELLLRKRLAAPVGRGAFTLRTFVPSDPTKSLPVPRICLTGKLFGRDDTKITVSPPDSSHLHWGEFHNGVAAGLRIVAAEGENDLGAGHTMTRSWIVKHKPSDTDGNATHAGMLLAFGLSGYLPTLLKTDYYQYLVPRHELTSIGLMLGVAAGNMGSMHEKLTKMMCLHIQYFNAPGFAVPDFNVSVNVQTSAILGLGLLHRGSPEQMIIEGLFAELGRSPKPGSEVDNREGLALAAGLSIGSLCLGSGSLAFAAVDRRYIEELILYANGGPMEKLGMPNGFGNGERTKKTRRAGQDQAASSLTDSEASRVKEGNFVNVDVVSPGALLALALIYLKTNDKRLASRIVLPNTLYTLDRSRPDHVFLRILARSLIMWNDISPSKEWILESMPSLLHAITPEGKVDPLDILGKINITDIYKDNEVDVNGILAARAFAAAGACTALSLKYAGTNDPSAVSILHSACVSFENAMIQQDDQFQSLEWVLSTCFCSVALGIAVVCAGSGDLEVFRLLRRLRKRRGTATGGQYGVHLALHLAIGFLFLGGGCLTFGSSDTAIFGLLCALYPQFPREPSDNRYHLQAMRHLYVLAVEPRCIETRDVDTGKPCCVDVEILRKNGSKLVLRAPCIVPEAGGIKNMTTASERYMPSTVRINPPLRGKGWYSNTRNQVFFVKRRTGHLPYTEDPRGTKGILARSSTRSDRKEEDGVTYDIMRDEKLIKSFSVDPGVLAFVKYLCGSSTGGQETNFNWMWQPSTCSKILLECLSSDKPEALHLYMDAARAADAIGKRNASPSVIGGLVLADTYIHSRGWQNGSMMKPSYIASILRGVQQSVYSPHLLKCLLRYIRSEGKEWPTWPNECAAERELMMNSFAVLLRFSRIPPVSDMAKLSAMLRGLSDSDGADNLLKKMSDADFSSYSEKAIETICSALESESTWG